MRSLRSQLIISHILPLLAVIPILFVALSYLLETRLLLPTLTQNLADDARLLTEITRSAYLVSGDLSDARFPLAQLDLNPNVRLVFLNAAGEIEYSNDHAYLERLGERVQPPGIERARSGETVLLTDYAFLGGRRYSIQVLAPVRGLGREVVGMVWMTYYDAALTELFQQMRRLTILVALTALAVGAVIGSLIALNIGRPVRRAAEAIHDLAGRAQGLGLEDAAPPLAEQGPDEVRELTRAVNVLVARLHSLEQARRQLLANLVHELGRPLGALRAAIQALAKGAADEPQLLGELTAGMDEEAARLQTIVEDLAHLYGKALGPLELDRRPTPLGEWLPGVLAPWHEAASEKNIDWATSIPDNLPTLAVDQLRLGQIIGNLASNAVKYTPTGGKVLVEADVQDDVVRLAFSDNGSGIPQAEQEKIFEPFYRGAHGRRIKQGMGLGLSIARDLAAAHGGSVTVESAVGKGSRFTLWLPLDEHRRIP